MLDYRASARIAEARAPETELIDDPFECGREHVLIADVGIGAVGAGERNACATDDGDAANLGTNEHEPLRDAAGICTPDEDQPALRL